MLNCSIVNRISVRNFLKLLVTLCVLLELVEYFFEDLAVRLYDEFNVAITDSRLLAYICFANDR